MVQFKNIAFLLASATAFSPNTHHRHHYRPSSLGVSVVSEFLSNKGLPRKKGIEKKDSDDQRIQENFETETPESVGVKNLDVGHDKSKQTKNKKKKRSRKGKRKHNFSELETFLNEVPDLDFYTLHSSVVSHLYLDMPINDIIRAIKRAQNRHDAHDLKTIGAFLIDECDEHWGYGFRGTLLSRLSVAALHLKETDLALRAIETRRVYERPSMQPFESAGIVRGLLRAGLREEAWNVLEDELRLPLKGTALNSPENKEVIKQRAHALSSIASRFFYHTEPEESERALQKLGELGTFALESGLSFNDLDMPWIRLEAAALECNNRIKEKSGPDADQDFRELVWNAMVQFPCPGEEEECTVDSYLLAP